jgi:antitoxin component of MazEF toxin-antitoxin module
MEEIAKRKNIKNSYTASIMMIQNNDTRVFSLKLKQWGNSLGTIIPKQTADELGLKPGEEILVEVRKKRSVLREFFGALPRTGNAADILREQRKEWESKWL